MFLNKLLCLSFIILSGAVFAQEIKLTDRVKTRQLDEVVITATRTERKIATLPLPTSIITAADIAKAGITKLDEILSEQTGLVIVPDFGYGNVEGVQMQGLDSQYILVLIDGVPLVGRSAGTLDLTRVAVGNIDRIEIVKGASSSLYGSEALAGVINIITKKPKSDVLTGNASYRYATFNTTDANLNVLWKKKKLSASVFSNYFSSDGYNLDPNKPIATVLPYQNKTLQPKLYYTFSDKLNVLLDTRFYHQNQINQATVNAEVYQGNLTTNEWSAFAKTVQKWNSKIVSEYEFYVTNYQLKESLNNTSNQLFDSSYYNQWLFRPEARTTFSIQKNKLTIGTGLNHETLDRTYFDDKIAFNSQYLYSQYDYNPTQKWNILLGFRYDHHNQFQSKFSPKLAVNYKISDYLSLKSSVGFGFKAPDFRELYFDFTNPTVGYTVLGHTIAEVRLNELQSQGQLISRVPNINFSDRLKPESSINYNLGAYFQKGKLKFEINAFYNLITNLIDTKVVAQKTNGQNVFSYLNVNKVFTYGIENNITYNFTKDFKISAGYQYLTAKDQSVVANFETYQYVRNQQTLESFQIKKSDYFGLFNRSKHNANIKFSYSIPKIKTDIHLRILYRSKFGLVDTNGNGVLDKYDHFIKGYFITNLSFTKTIAEKFSLQCGANNLLNFTNPQEITNISGRQIFGKLQYNF